MKTIWTLCLLAYCCAATAQSNTTFSAQVSSDSILIGHYFKVTFSLENVNSSDFQAPEFEGFQIVSGPISSSRTTVINGEQSQSMSYTYYLSPTDIGTYYIAPATVEVAGDIWSSEPIAIHVHPNPDGILQQSAEKSTRSLFDNFWYRHEFPTERPAAKKEKKKRLTKRI